ncbi:unnamed protein product [Candida verbasci]|uniref:Thioesterase domain-containing protein n=1 Tax=Candida verbasci TaxID=1227364 RepID=A0A9W4XFF1_9ASCO|nr:unnamed protein product [Candida verbasci]
MFKSISRKTIPIFAFGLGLAIFPKEWRKTSWNDKKINHINESIVSQIEQSNEFKKLQANKDLIVYNSSSSFPNQHHDNYVGTGLLFGPNLMEIDPIVFLDKRGELTSFYYLGDELISQDGQIHNGIISTILDEGICSAGFPLLPSKKGVTAQLSINFKNQAPPKSTLMLKAKVKQHKGRKVVIEGELTTFPLNGEKSIVIANADCILVEPKWFKWFRWLQV